jgi:outer membrane protein OmpA-like peptidoglycan-associated protein
MGGFDLFYSRKDSAESWQKAGNLGYPINTNADEITLLVNAKGDVAYVSSGKFGGKGKQDIYSFKLYPDAQPVAVTYFKGIVYDKETGKRLKASFDLTDLSTGKEVARSESDPATGEFLLILPANRDYALSVNREGYLFFSENFALEQAGTSLKPVIRKIPLQPMRAGETVVLRNIFFDTDKYDLKPQSQIELERLTDLLRKNPGMRIEISGHTDKMGTPEHNVVLSANRAKAVYEYLVSKGIAKERLTYAGYGQDRPIDTNDTDEGRARNRRTEFRVISF